MKTRILCIALALLSVFLAVPATAYADAGPETSVSDPVNVAPATPAVIADPGTDPGGFVASMAKAIADGNWRLVAAGLLIAVGWLLRRFGPKKLQGDRGGAIMALALGVIGSVVLVLLSPAALTPWVIVNGIVLGATVAGGFTLVKKILWPSDTGVLR